MKGRILKKLILIDYVFLIIVTTSLSKLALLQFYYNSITALFLLIIQMITTSLSQLALLQFYYISISSILIATRQFYSSYNTDDFWSEGDNECFPSCFSSRLLSLLFSPYPFLNIDLFIYRLKQLLIFI